jgi:hypothetical protein
MIDLKWDWLTIMAFLLFCGCLLPAKANETPTYTAYYTYPDASGNRYLPKAHMNLLAETTGVVEANLPGVPIWLVSFSTGGTAAWLVGLQDGALLAFRWDQGKLLPLDLPVESLPPGMPPTVIVSEVGEVSIANILVPDLGPATAPTLIDQNALRLAYVNDKRELVVRDDDGSTQTLQLNALSDTRIVLDGDTIALLTDPATHYTHGALGNVEEPTTISMVRAQPQLEMISKIKLAEGVVMEAVSPLWADVTGDGESEIIVTLANTPVARGASITVFTRRGDLVAKGELSPGGWRHLLGVAPTGPAGEIEVIDIQKPHVQKIVNFYRTNGQALNVAAHRTSYSSHDYGSTNIYIVLMGDFDGDPSNIELLVPDADRRLVKMLARRPEGQVDELGSLDPGGVLSSNFSWVASEQESFFAVGTESQVLRIWWSKNLR